MRSTILLACMLAACGRVGFDQQAGAEAGVVVAMPCNADTCPGGNCNGDQCRIACGITCTCPPGVDCLLDCGVNAGDCSGKIDCGTAAICNVKCSADNSCAGTIHGDAAGMFGVGCSGTSSCQGAILVENSPVANIGCTGQDTCAEIICGTGPCTADCRGNGSCFMALDCKDSCACDITCAAGACTSGASCPAGCTSGLGCTSASPCVPAC